MRSDDRFFFLLVAGVMTLSLLYTLFAHVLPAIELRHTYVWAHCTATGLGKWEKYETVEGIKERVAVPVEVRIGPIGKALDWGESGAGVLKSTDIYHQGIARDEPSGWEYFTAADKQNYLNMYKPNREYECWSRPSTGFRDNVFYKKSLTKRLVPPVIFCVIVMFLCFATGVCVGVVDLLRQIIGLPSYKADDGAMDTVAGVNYGATQSGQYQQRQFANSKGQDLEWV